MSRLLVIAKPRKAFTDNEKVILDQYIMHGGKTLWMIGRRECGNGHALHR
ncbi:Gldg family protein [Halpernia sp. GG3]